MKLEQLPLQACTNATTVPLLVERFSSSELQDTRSDTSLLVVQQWRRLASWAVQRVNPEGIVWIGEQAISARLTDNCPI